MKRRTRCSLSTARIRGPLVAVLVGGLGLAGLSALSPAPAAAALPSQCSASGNTVTCTFFKSGGDQVLDLPGSVDQVTLRVVGEAGAQAPGAGGGAGGRGAVVQGVRNIDAGVDDLSIQFLDDGGASARGGAGGGSTRVQLTRRTPLTIAWAAGGGGGGDAGQSIDATGSPVVVPGGTGGTAGGSGADGSIDSYADAGKGGGPGTSTAGGTGGAGGFDWAGQADSGGDGSRGAGGGATGGGGGGGGLYGGGGGGSGGTTATTFPLYGAAGGGGGGSSVVPPGGSTTPASYAETPRVVVTFTMARATLTPTSWAFPSTNVDKQSTTKAFTLTNTGASGFFLNVSDVALTGPGAAQFAITGNTCPASSIFPGVSCTISVAFRPTSTGLKSAQLVVTSDAYDSPQQVSLSGTGTQPVAAVTPESVTFTDTVVGVAGPRQLVRLTNIGDGPLTMTSTPTITGTDAASFLRASSTCGQGTVLSAGADCRVVVEFRPQSRGPKSAVLRFSTDAPRSPHDVALTGRGLAPVAEVSPPSIDFGTVGVPYTSAPRDVVVTNNGDAVMNVGTVSVSGAAADYFAPASDACSGSALAPNASCTVAVEYTPGGTGSHEAQLRIPTDAPGSPHPVELSGTGAGPTLLVSTLEHDFGNADVDGPTKTRTQILTNDGPGILYVDDVSLTGPHAGDYSVDALDCLTRELGPGDTCEITVVFGARGVGTRTAQMVIDSNAADSPRQVALTGNGVPTAVLHIRGPGSAYAEGHGNRQTLTIGTGETAQAKFYLKIFNKTATARTYRIATNSSGAAASVKLTLTSNAVDLPKAADGAWITPSVPAGGSKILVFRVDPAGPGQVTAKHTVFLRTASGAEHDYARFETNIEAPAKGTDGYGLYAKSSGGFVGGDVNGQTATQAPYNTGQTKSYTIRVRNDSTVAHPVLVKVQEAANACWTITIKKGTVNVTESFTSGGYTTPVIKPGAYVNLAVKVKRVAAGCGSAQWEFSTWSGTTRKHHSTILANALAGTE